MPFARTRGAAAGDDVHAERPWEMLSIVVAMRAAIGGGMVSTAQVANSGCASSQKRAPP